PVTQHYLRDSNILETRFDSISGSVVLTDFMPVEALSAWPYKGMNNNTWTREDGSCHCVVRIIECTHGQMPVTMTLKVTPSYAESPSQVFLTPDNRGAVISGSQQHVGLAIVGTELLLSFCFSVFHIF